MPQPFGSFVSRPGKLLLAIFVASFTVKPHLQVGRIVSNTHGTAIIRWKFCWQLKPTLWQKQRACSLLSGDKRSRFVHNNPAWQLKENSVSKKLGFQPQSKGFARQVQSKTQTWNCSRNGLYHAKT